MTHSSDASNNPRSDNRRSNSRRSSSKRSPDRRRDHRSKGAAPGQRRRRSSAPTPPLDRAYRDLERWIRQRLATALGPDVELPPTIDLRLDLPLQLRGEGRESAEKRFRDVAERELARWLEQHELDRLGYQNGHVFCHWCRAPICEHSAPPDARSVFVGYEATGKPLWREFTSWVVALRDERVDQLFAEPPTALALYLPGDVLEGELLPDFRRGPIRIACQAVAGLFQVPKAPSAGAGWESLAVTVQLIERRLDGGDPSYTLNVICTVPEGHHLPTMLAQNVSRPLSRFVASLTTELHRLEDEFRSARRQGRRISLRRARERARQSLERAPVLLEKYLRQGSRRTQHAELRGGDPDRPTASARADALRTAAEYFFDRKENTVIVRGPRNRVHVFREDGTHITSVIYPGKTVQQRLRMHRWVPLEPARVTSFREQLAAQ
ncbi:MAG: hypothetical protein AAF581_08390 [Planctomycetota bacterium]